VVVIDEVGPQEWALVFFAQGKGSIIFSYFDLIGCRIFYVEGMLYMLLVNMFEV